MSIRWYLNTINPGKCEGKWWIQLLETILGWRGRFFLWCGPSMPFGERKEKLRLKKRQNPGSRVDLSEKKAKGECVCPSDELVVRWENRGLTGEDAAMWCLVLTSPCCCGPCETRITTGAKVVIPDFERLIIRMRRIECLISDCVYLQYCGMELPSRLLHTTPHVGENAFYEGFFREIKKKEEKKVHVAIFCGFMACTNLCALTGLRKQSSFLPGDFWMVG